MSPPPLKGRLFKLVGILLYRIPNLPLLSHSLIYKFVQSVIYICMDSQTVCTLDYNVIPLNFVAQVVPAFPIFFLHTLSHTYC